jgi:hypothetical protein
MLEVVYEEDVLLWQTLYEIKPMLPDATYGKDVLLCETLQKWMKCCHIWCMKQDECYQILSRG